MGTLIEGKTGRHQLRYLGLGEPGGILYTMSTAGRGGKEGRLVAKVMEVLRKTELTPEQRKALGLSVGWQDKVSPEFLKTVSKIIDKNKEALKKLEKY